MTYMCRYKYWTCCQRRTSDFDEFLKQEGCTTGEHKWIEVGTHTHTHTHLFHFLGLIFLWIFYLFLQTEKRKWVVGMWYDSKLERQLNLAVRIQVWLASDRDTSRDCILRQGLRAWTVSIWGQPNLGQSPHLPLFSLLSPLSFSPSLFLILWNKWFQV